MNTIGERIIFLREELEISQKALAVSIQTTAATLSRYENNLYEPKGETLVRLASALHTTSDFLLGLTADYHRPDPSGEAIPALTAEEYRLLKLYRTLSPDNQIRIQERILTLSEHEREATK